jgi:hypothetical protein
LKSLKSFARRPGVEITAQFKHGPVDVPRSVLDISRAEKCFGGRPKTSISDGVSSSFRMAIDNMNERNHFFSGLDDVGDASVAHSCRQFSRNQRRPERQ